jgi:thiamine biosynthesis lipoprotein
MGPDKGMQLATRHDLAARLVLRTSAGAQEYMTPRLAAMLA